MRLMWLAERRHDLKVDSACDGVACDQRQRLGDRRTRRNGRTAWRSIDPASAAYGGARGSLRSIAVILLNPHALGVPATASLLIRPGGPNRKLIGPVDRGRPRGPEGRAGPEHPK